VTTAAKLSSTAKDVKTTHPEHLEISILKERVRELESKMAEARATLNIDPIGYIPGPYRKNQNSNPPLHKRWPRHSRRRPKTIRVIGHS
jgi:hypothetical protein